MAYEEFQRDFPKLNARSYNPPHSAKDFNHNCLAFALGDLTNWWEPPVGYGRYWPPGFPDDAKVTTVVAILRAHGFVVQRKRTAQIAEGSIAIFAKGEEWEHFAKFSEGKWWSKLGDGHDIWHHTLQELEGGLYGHVVMILRRRAVRRGPTGSPQT